MQLLSLSPKPKESLKYEAVKTKKTWAWIKAIPNCKLEKAIIKKLMALNKKKDKILLVIILYVNPLKFGLKIYI